jgi:S-adenosylmethionine hydrolase
MLKRMVVVFSDFGADSFYVGVMKGVVCSAAPESPVVDLTHSIAPHDVSQASFVLDTVFDFFPRGVVFLAVIDPGVGGERRNLIVEIGGGHVVGPDNGLVTEIAARKGVKEVRVIDESKLDPYRVGPPVGRTFLGRDVFAPAAGALAAGADLREVGSPTDEPPVALDVPPVEVGAGRISARARYVDDFGNILTAVTRDRVNEAFGGAAPGEIVCTVGGVEAGTLCRYYSERPAGELMAVLNSWDRLEVSVRDGSAAERFESARVCDLAVELTARSE